MKSFLYRPLKPARLQIRAAYQGCGRKAIVGFLCLPGITIPPLTFVH